MTQIKAYKVDGGLNKSRSYVTWRIYIYNSPERFWFLKSLKSFKDRKVMVLVLLLIHALNVSIVLLKMFGRSLENEDKIYVVFLHLPDKHKTTTFLVNIGISR